MNSKERERLYDFIKYHVWCITFEYNPKLCETRSLYRDYLKNTKYHRGDCTQDSCPCDRCLYQDIEIKAQNLVDSILTNKIGVKNKIKKGWCGDDCLYDCKYEGDKK